VVKQRGFRVGDQIWALIEDAFVPVTVSGPSNRAGAIGFLLVTPAKGAKPLKVSILNCYFGSATFRAYKSAWEQQRTLLIQVLAQCAQGGFLFASAACFTLSQFKQYQAVSAQVAKLAKKIQNEHPYFAPV
jgi:hypothetical protein